MTTGTRIGLGLLALALAAVACSGGTRTASLPPVGGSVGPTHRTTLARLVIHVPSRKHAKKVRLKNGHYISPATASLTWSVSPALAGGANSGEMDINTSNPDCSVTGVVGYLQCSLDITGVVPSVAYTFSFTTWDAAGGTGNMLSANDSVPFTATPGQTNLLSATLGGVASSLLVTPVTPYRITSSQSGLTVYGNDAVKFTVTPLDAQDNFIIGPGAPEPSASLAPGTNATLVAVGSTSPNEWALTSTYEPSDPGIPSTTTLNVTSTPVPGSGGSTLTSSTPVKLYQPWIYVSDAEYGTIRAFDEDGNVKSPAGGFPGLSAPGGMAYDPDNGFLYISDLNGAVVTAYDRAGNVQIATFAVAPHFVIGMAFDSHNHWIYVAQGGSTGQIAAYDEHGNAQSTPGGFTPVPNVNGSGFRQMAFDPVNRQLYAAQNFANVISVYDETGAAVTTSGGFPNLPGAATSCSAYDPLREWIWTCDGSNVAAYDGDGNSELPSSGLSASPGTAAAFDPYNGLLYIITSSSGDLNAYDPQGNQHALPSPVVGDGIFESTILVK
jgi:hypothetical protein